MTISFGSTGSEKRQLDKDVSYSVSATGRLRNDTGVVNPTILVDASAATLSACNYMSIPDFHRLYFITEIRAVTDQLSEVSGHCDVLSTYKAGIRTNRAIVGRSATQGNWNLYLNDPMVKVTSVAEILTKKGWKSFPKDQFSLMLVTMG